MFTKIKIEINWICKLKKTIHWINYSLFLVVLASKGGWSGHGDSSVRFCQWSKWCRKKWHAEVKFVMITKALPLCVLNLLWVQRTLQLRFWVVDSFNMFESEPNKESSVYYISSTVLIITSNTGMIFFKIYIKLKTHLPFSTYYRALRSVISLRQWSVQWFFWIGEVSSKDGQQGKC